jgi:quinol monooxygenase YgiN
VFEAQDMQSTTRTDDMANGKLTAIAKIKAKPGMEDRVKQGLLDMLAPSRADKGNLNYNVFQSNDDPTLFFTHENWTGKDALDNHMQTPHFKKLDAESKETLAQPMEVYLLSAIGE